MSLPLALERRAEFYRKNIAEIRDRLDLTANERLVLIANLRVNETALAEVMRALDHERAIESVPPNRRTP